MKPKLAAGRRLETFGGPRVPQDAQATPRAPKMTPKRRQNGAQETPKPPKRRPGAAQETPSALKMEPKEIQTGAQGPKIHTRPSKIKPKRPRMLSR